MAYYEHSLEIPANTPAAAPVKLTWPLSRGVITRMTVFFPPGCAGLARIRIFRGHTQTWPLDLGEWIKGDGQEVLVESYYELTAYPYELNVEGINLDDTYPHTPVLRCIIVPEEVGNLARVLGRIAGLFVRR
jgi:hypothetical protein